MKEAGDRDCQCIARSGLCNWWSLVDHGDRAVTLTLQFMLLTLFLHMAACSNDR